MEGHPCTQEIQKVYFSSSRESCHSWPKWALCGVKCAGQDKLWVLMWVLWDLRCWSKINLRDTGFLEDTSGGGPCLDGEEPDLEGEAHPERLAWPRLLDYPRLSQGWVLFIAPHSPHSSNDGRSCQNNTCCGWIWEQCSFCSKNAGWGPRGSPHAQQMGAPLSALQLVQFY